MDRPTYSLTLPSELRMLSVARRFVEAVCEAHQLERTVLHALVIVTGEAVTNIIRHAHHHVVGAQMAIHVEFPPDCIVLTFHDEGEPFDFDAVPQLPPGEVRIGGRGIFLMRALMDEVSYEPCSAGARGNVLRMVKRCALKSIMRACG